MALDTSESRPIREALLSDSMRVHGAVRSVTCPLAAPVFNQESGAAHIKSLGKIDSSCVGIVSSSTI